MREAIRERAASLPETLRGIVPQEVYTLHRLLGVVPGLRRFRHNAGNPIPLDVLVVDEASMLDLALATRLLEALPDHARLIFLGDKDQLAAVEAGAVFHEIGSDPMLGPGCIERLARVTGLDVSGIQPPRVERHSPLQDCVVWLTESLRFQKDSEIARLASEINAGDAQAAIARFSAHGDASLDWVADGAIRPAETSLERLSAGFGSYREAVQRFDGNTTPVLAAFDRFRILCAVRGSERGVEQINRSVAAAFRQNLRHEADDGRTPWYPGRPVIVLRNDYSLGLFNGDIGLTLADEKGRLQTYFPISGGRFLSLTPARLPPHEY